MSTRRVRVFSSGGGVQSTAIMALILQKKIEMPDYIVMADTERERTSTWEYLEKITGPAMRNFDLPIHVIPKSQFTDVDLVSKNGKSLLMPVFTTYSGKLGRLPTFCSSEWKRYIVMRYLRKVLKIKRAEMWLGISIDESNRMTLSKDKWLEHRYPLIEKGLSRQDCIQIVEDMGWPTPPKSACWSCPHGGNKDWRKLRDEYPEDFQKAIELDEHLRSLDPLVSIHLSGKPLKEADLGDEVEGEMTCTSNMCWT